MISIAVCDDNEITAQEISEKVKQCCPIEAEVSVFYHIKDGFSFRTFMSLVLSISPKLYRKWTAHR